MNEFYGYVESAFLISPLFCFIVAVGFRLLDNSGYLFLEQEININSSYVSLKLLREQVHNSTDEGFRRKLKQVLLYRRLHLAFLVLALISLPFTIWTYLYGEWWYLV